MELARNRANQIGGKFGKMQVYKVMQMHSQLRVDSVSDRRNLAFT